MTGYGRAWKEGGTGAMPSCGALLGPDRVHLKERLRLEHLWPLPGDAADAEVRQDRSLRLVALSAAADSRHHRNRLDASPPILLGRLGEGGGADAERRDGKRRCQPAALRQQRRHYSPARRHEGATATVPSHNRIFQEEFLST